jgi:hypothetical protein
MNKSDLKLQLHTCKLTSAPEHLVIFLLHLHKIMSDIGDFSYTAMQKLAVNTSQLERYLYLFFQLTDLLVCLTQFSHQL